MNSELTAEQNPKKKSKLKRLIPFIIILEVAAFLTAISMFVVAIVSTDFDVGWKFSSIGGGIFFGVVGSSMVLMIVGFFTGIRRGRKGMFSGPTGSDARTAPYTTTSYTKKTSSRSRTFLCEYCGYKVSSKERECPKCKGPIKEG
ncbi:MAG: hypothetical protein GPJ51_06975 [Candidatus Heimdallarchaeota archaeon]|nr:hypothetical protein [Candidatus Heimdallarchaeota archaeon]